MSNQHRNDDRRRQQAQGRHSVAVHLMGNRLAVLCRCGAVLGGGRTEDARFISLMDLIEIRITHEHKTNSQR